MTANSTTIAALAVDNLRRQSRASEISQGVIADKLHTARQTINSKFKRGDMKLTEFIRIAQTVGAIPHEILQDAEKRSESADNNPAFAEEQRS
ncbi:hypothetical protein [Bifidobacterium tibiigranuli]|uniref:XRE family transcriptional regulator n=1 Tax=Bifidobacterium tibiigranuli TaxID=2172043 RepID=A0A5N6S1L7_9BIFI|nr:hypothetical protein [Bifidobacterium tibiigranuli]KAE8127323.1 hypothetical protein DDF78_08855 [Bifidobacterium tibiigranuli]KAE8129714.1 hypothetical protein DDE84_02635 [Bifidobacterium tibiigranuli]